MGRNQYDISDEDLRGLRTWLLEQQAPPPEKHAEIERALEKVRKDAMAKARQRKALKDKEAAERHKKALSSLSESNKFFEEQGFGESLLTADWVDPHREMEYCEYLQSPLWKKIRRRVLKRDRGICQLCQAKATEVHHRSYDTDVMLGKNDAGCISLCEKCHHSIEFTQAGEHRSLEQKEAILVSFLQSKNLHGSGACPRLALKGGN